MTAPHFTIEVLVEPGRTLGPTKARLLSDLLALCKRTASFDASALLAEEIDHATWLVVVRRGAEAVGFSMASLLPVDGSWVLYLNFMVFAREARGWGLLNEHIELFVREAARRLQGGDFYLVSLSGNAQIVGAVHHYPWAYPRPGRPTPPDHRQLALAFARQVYPRHRCDPEPPVLRKISPQDTSVFGLARHRDPRVNDFCDRHLDYAAGDELVLVGRIGTLQRWMIYAACRAGRTRAWVRRRGRAARATTRPARTSAPN